MVEYILDKKITISVISYLSYQKVYHIHWKRQGLDIELERIIGISKTIDDKHTIQTLTYFKVKHKLLRF